MLKIRASVGREGLNKKGDVRTIQHLLNMKIEFLTPLRLLTEDDDIGPMTIGAIEEFQRRVVKLAKPDGRVDVGGRTLMELNRVPSTSAPVKSPLPTKKADGSGSVTVTYAADVPQLVSDYAFTVIKLALRRAGMTRAVITSTVRQPIEQARIMYDNASKNLSKQYQLYGSTGDAVLDIYNNNHKTKLKHEVINMMKEKITELRDKGRKTSRHVVNDYQYKKRNVIDIGVNSTRAVNPESFSIEKLTSAFWELKKLGYIAHFIDETKKSNHCWHLEIIPNQKLIIATGEGADT